MSFFNLFGMPVVSPASPCPNPSIERIHLRPCQGRKPSKSACLVPDGRIAVSSFWQDARSGCVWFPLCWSNAFFQNGIEEPSWYPFQKWVCMVPSLLIIKNKNDVQAMVCFQNGIEEPSIMIPISWYGNFPIMIAINRDTPAFKACQLKQLQLNCLFKVRVLYSTVLENMSIQWKTCQGWTSRYIFVDMLTNCLWF